MLKRIISIAVLSALTSSMAFADEASVKKALEEAYPKFKIDSVTKTPFKGLYEVYAGNQITYTDENVSYLITNGNLLDQKTKNDLTSLRMAELNRIDFAKLPLDKAIKVVKGNGSRKLVVFSDVDCPYCKMLEQKSLANITDVTIYTFLFPVAQLHPDAATKSKSIWCANDRAKAWNEWVFNDKLPKEAKAKCDAPLDQVGELAQSINVNSTPTLFFSNGKRMLGAQPQAEIERVLAETGK